MTRFARAKGSKASNVKTPADSTPWEVMKEQLMKSKQENEEASKREEAEKQRIENYNKFLKEHKTQKRQATWCDFPESVEVKKAKVTPELEIKSKKKKKKKNITKSNILLKNTESDNNKSLVESCDNAKNKKHKTNKNMSTAPQEFNLNDSHESQTELQKNKLKKKKKGKKKSEGSTDKIEGDNINNKHVNAFHESNIASANISQENDLKFKKKKKDKKLLDEISVTDKGTPLSVTENGKKSVEEHNHKLQENKKKKLKILNGNPTRRKAINDRSFELIINGKNIELVRFDGFPIMKKDAERLQELKNNMIKKGIPKTEVQRTMKLERRRAEKALARLKREVCYNCRKGGHNLSDCPDLKSNIPGKEAAEGICFKCGSTEHRQFECKVQRDKEFRFATCFICKESGHIARQCPDNPKGLYPNGGCCKLCGDVTHLRKDCPTVMDKKEESSIKLQTLSTDSIEGIGQQVINNSEEKHKKPKKIKF